MRIELEAQARTVTVRRDQIPPEDGGAPMPRPAPAFASGGATPAHAGMRTPAYASATPKHTWVRTPLSSLVDALVLLFALWSLCTDASAVTCELL